MSAQLLSVRHTHPAWAEHAPRFPFTVPTIAHLDTLDLDAPVTCFVGENGSGKSTLLEAIAIAAGLPSVGSADWAQDDSTLVDQQRLARALTLAWRTRRYRGFFLRAEDFFGYQLQLIRERAAFDAELQRIEVEYADRSAHAKSLAMGPCARAWATWSGATGRIRTRGRMARHSSTSSSSGWYRAACT